MPEIPKVRGGDPEAYQNWNLLHYDPAPTEVPPAPPGIGLEIPEYLQETAKPYHREPIPFDLEGYINQINTEADPEKLATNRSAIGRTLHYFTRPFLAQGYNTLAALNRGTAAFYQHLDNIAGFIEVATDEKLERGGLFEKMARLAESDAAYWRKRAEDVGITFVDEIVSEALGGFAPGVTKFVMDVGSGFTFSYMGGAYSGYKQGENPFEQGMIEAARTGILHHMFRMMQPLKQYLRAPLMGSIFGLQEAEMAPEGQRTKAFVKGAAIGAAYSLTSPGGRIGLNEARENFSRTLKADLEVARDMAAASADILTDQGGGLRSFTPEWIERVRNIAIARGLYRPEKFDKFVADATSIRKHLIENELGCQEVIIEGGKPMFSPLKPNAWEKLSVDMTTICPKRVNMERAITERQTELGRGLTAKELLKLRKQMKARGEVVSCGACYVSRLRMGEEINNMIDMHPEVPRELWFSQDGMDRVAMEYPDAFMTFKKRMGARGIKMPESYAEIDGQILSMTQRQVDWFNERRGLRWFSWSDFEIAHILDAMQATAESEAIALKSYAYTKVPEFCEVQGKTGQMINQSLMPVGATGLKKGKLAFDDVEGMPFERAMQNREKYPDTVGNEIMGVSDAQIRAALDDPRIDTIIPFHRSGLSEEFRDKFVQKGWQDYTRWGTEKPLAPGITITKEIINDIDWYTIRNEHPRTKPEKLAQIYLERCKKHGIQPQFPQFADHPNYYKLLVDFKQYDHSTGKMTKHRPMEMNYDMDVVNNVIQKFLEGETPYLTKPSAVGMARAALESERGVFAGFGAKLPPSKLGIAQRMDAKGESKEKIWKKTGWIKGVEGEWRFEISDKGASLTGEFQRSVKRRAFGEFLFRYKLPDIFKHPKLYEQYPFLKELDVYFKNLGRTRGQIRGTGRGMPTLELNENLAFERPLTRLKETIIHEVQHMIQDREWFAKGGAPEHFLVGAPEPRIIGLAQSLRSFAENNNLTIDQVVEKAPRFLQDAVKEDAVVWLAKVPQPDFEAAWTAAQQQADPIGSYLRLAGEIEARDAAARLKMTAAERRKTVPYSSADIPPEEWIIRQRSGIMKSVEEPPKKKRPRKFLRTTERAEATAPEVKKELKEGIVWETVSEISGAKMGREIDKEYIVQPNVDSLNKAEQRIARGLNEAVDWAKDPEVPFNAEKGATFITLMERFQKEGDYDRAVEMIESYDRQLREAGRFVQAASIWSKLSPPGFVRWANKQLEAMKSKYTWVDTLFGRKPESFTLTKEEQRQILEKFKEINQMEDGVEKTDAVLQMIDVVAQKVPPSINELIDAYRYQNMLSSPKTQERNIGENVFNTFITAPIDITTKGAIDYVKSSLYGTERENYVRDVATYYKMALNAVPNASKAFMETMKLSRSTTLEKPELGMEATTEFERARAKQMPGALTLVGRFMEASDKFNSALIGAGQMALLKKQGIPDAEAYRRASELAQMYLYREGLDPKSKEISYMSKALSSMAKMVKDSRRLPVLGTLSKWYVPFIQTPANKGIQMIERSPLGAVRGEFSREALAKVISGSVVTAIGAVYALQGETTWTAPTDKKEKQLFYETGRKPFSVKLGEKWVPMWYLGPYALAFAIPTAIKHYVHDRKQALTDDGIDKLINIAEGLAQFIGSQTSTQSVGALFSALHGDIDFKFSSQTGFTVQQVIPLSAMVRYVNTILDPVYRHPQGFVEKIEANLPYFSKSIEPYTTSLLEESRREVVNYFLPYDLGVEKPLYEALYDIQRFTLRQEHLEREIDRITADVRDGKITPEESLERVMKVIQASPKSLQMLGEELQDK